LNANVAWRCRALVVAFVILTDGGESFGLAGGIAGGGTVIVTLAGPLVPPEPFAS
jgi:hypothetical protein